MMYVMKTALRLLNKPHIASQYSRFGIIGISAAIVNFLAVIAIVSLHWLSPLWANVIAFAVAFNVSFFGHKHWTFKRTGQAAQSLSKFLLIAIASFLLTQVLFAFFLKTEQLYYPLALAMTLLIVPPITFAASKVWAFR